MPCDLFPIISNTVNNVGRILRPLEHYLQKTKLNRVERYGKQPVQVDYIKL